MQTERGGERLSPASVLLCQHTSAAEEMWHWSSLGVALHSMAEYSSVLWEGKQSETCSSSFWMTFIPACVHDLSNARCDVPVLQAGPARCGTGHTGGVSGVRQHGTDLREEGGRIVLLRRIWPLLCFGQVSTTTSYERKNYFHILCMTHVGCFEDTGANIIPDDLQRNYKTAACIKISVTAS